MISLILAGALLAQSGTPPEHGKRPGRLVIRNAMVLEGNGTPAFGPTDITVVGDTITAIGRAPSVDGAAVIDARGRYVMPGLINVHAHIHDERAGLPMPLEYQMKLWLACGITTIRDVGSVFEKSAGLRERSKKGEIDAPRIFIYAVFSTPPIPSTEEQARARVREIKAKGADGLKFFAIHRDVMAAMMNEARKQGLRTAHHAAIAETNAWDDIRYGTTTIEHWYGIPDAALPEGVQAFPPEFNQTLETDRFRWAGRLWREASWPRLLEVLDGMVKAEVAWVPTLNIYEASRDLQRYQTQPWFADYLHPALKKFFEPNPENHGSYFEHWTSTDEAYWKENYRLWMSAVREFAKRGGLVGIGEDAGFIYNIYGFGMIRSMELHQEAGFPVLKVLEQATANNGRILGMAQRLGRVRVGYAADLLVINGNPVEDLKILYPKLSTAKGARQGIEWTIKDGIPYSAPRLEKEVRALAK